MACLVQLTLWTWYLGYVFFFPSIILDCEITCFHTYKFTTNTFTISTPSLTPIGACVSPVVALINHSCDPNAVVVFPRAGGESRKDKEPLMQVVALKYIAPDEEVCFFPLTSFIFHLKHSFLKKYRL